MITILVDIDSVVADIQTSWLEMYNEEYKDDLTVEDVTEWDMSKFVKPECGQDIYKYLSLPNFYENTEPVLNAIWGVHQLRKFGHRVVFVSAGFFPQKIEWLHDWGFLREYPYGDGRWQTSTDVILANDKSMIKGSLLIDDRPKNLDGFDGIKILFDQPWNRGDNRYYRAYGWQDVIEAVEKLYRHVQY